MRIVETLREAARELREYADQHDGTLHRQHARGLAQALDAEALVIERQYTFTEVHDEVIYSPPSPNGPTS